MRAAGWTFDRPGRLGAVQRLAGLGRRLLGDRVGSAGGLGPIPVGPALKWSRARDIPLPPRESFRAWLSVHPTHATRGGDRDDSAATLEAPLRKK